MLLGLVHPDAGHGDASPGGATSELRAPERAGGRRARGRELPPRPQRPQPPARAGRRRAATRDARVDEVLEQVGLTAARRPAREGLLDGHAPAARDRRGAAGRPRGADPRRAANGLDPPGIRWMRDLLRAQAGRGRAVLVSSHLLSEVAQSVDDVVVIAHGGLRGSGPLESVLGGADGPVTRVRAAEADAARRRCCASAGTRSSRTAAARCWCAAPRPSWSAQVARRARRRAGRAGRRVALAGGRVLRAHRGGRHERRCCRPS